MKEATKLSDETPISKEVIDNSDIVGVMLPLSSNLSSSTPASEILEGIKYALSEFNEGAKPENRNTDS